jgi:hypothetical protein
MSRRHENLISEQRVIQRDLDRSWEGAQRALADPEFRAYLERSIAPVNNTPLSRRLTKEEFLALTELSPE